MIYSSPSPLGLALVHSAFELGSFLHRASSVPAGDGHLKVQESQVLFSQLQCPITSDHADDPGVVITYTISGQGVTEPPYGLFVINGKTGELNITRKVDREKTPMFYLRGYALDQNGKNVEQPIDLRIKVKDINDNYPVFSEEIFTGSVEELSESGTLVMRINATDADEPNNINSKIAFKILQNQPSSFSIKKNTGEVVTAAFYLDREVNYTLL
uniref:Cadherin domain-containing protein n=1 Tax=Gopherus agassizii TaxID=38772 RepID=A0A452GKH1_9SAUR